MRIIARLIILAAIAAPFGRVQAQAEARDRTISPPWFPDTFTFLGNTVRGKERDHLLVALDIVHEGKFGIGIGRSDDDGKTWRFGEIAAHDPTKDLWDPSMARLPNGTLLLEYHAGGLNIIRSEDDGKTWHHAATFPGGGTEGYWQELPPEHRGGHSRLAILYGVVENHAHTRYEIRSTTDGEHYTNPEVVGDGGAIWDATRAGLGPYMADSGGILHAVYANRPPNSDSESVLMVTLDAHTLRPRGAPIVITRLTQKLRGFSVFPVVAECEDGDHVIFSTRGMRSALQEITVHHDGALSPMQTFVDRDAMSTGWGRVWFVHSWSGTPQISWVELPGGPHAKIYSIPRPDLSHCAY